MLTNTITTTPPAADAAAVATGLLAEMERAWNRADGRAFGAVFAEETDFVNIHGTHIRGDQTVIGDGHQAIFDTIYAGSTVEYRLELAREIAPGCVVALAASTLVCPGGPLYGTNHSRMTLVLAEEDDRWAVTAFHNTLVEERG